MKKNLLLILLSVVVGSSLAKAEDYLTFVANQNGSTIGLASLASHQTLEYSIDGTTWNNLTMATTITIDNGDSIFMRGVLTDNNAKNEDYTQFSMSGSIAANGNVNYLWNYENLDAPLKDYCGHKLFYECTALTKAPDLPSLALSTGCYFQMFFGCTSLTEAPALPATSLAPNCYTALFRGCSSLQAPPELPATSLASDCYSQLFYGCSALTIAPQLPATTLARTCYGNMFRECTSLISPPELPAENLANNCYVQMFFGCTSLSSAPTLSATTLADTCYWRMFRGCTSLTTAPELPATTLTTYCYNQMFMQTAITTAPDLPAPVLADYCYYQMFYQCSNLNYIKCLATDISATGCTSGWGVGVAPSGTFVKNSNMNSWTSAHIPAGWTIQNNDGTPIEQEGVSGVWKIGKLYYNLDGKNKTAEVTYACCECSSNYSNLTSVTIPASVTYNSVKYKVTSIGDRAFYACRGLTSITIPNTITSIKEKAFQYCSGLTSVILPDGITSIDEWAFGYCSNLTSITIPKSITSIESNSFYQCNVNTINFDGNINEWVSKQWKPTSIASTYSLYFNNIEVNDVVIPEGVTSIVDYAFSGCISLANVSLPNSILSIGKYAFSRCANLPIYDNLRYADTYLVDAADKSLTSYSIRNGTKWIGDNAFYRCTNMTSIDVPNSIVTFGERAFYQCSNMSSITIPNSVTSIGEMAFYECTGLTSVTIPNSVTSIGDYAFYLCSGLTSIVVEEGNPIYNSRDNCNALVETATNNLIVGCRNTTIPNSVTSIKKEAFYGCTGLTSIEIPNSIDTIGNHAFAKCTNLRTVTNYATTPQSISSGTFDNVPISSCKLYVQKECVDLYKAADIWKKFSVEPIIYLIDGITYNIDFSNSTAAVIEKSPIYTGNIVIPSQISYNGETYTVTSIDKQAFRHCVNLSSISFPNSLTSIGTHAFDSCINLQSITIPNSVTSTGEYAFANCTGLTSASLGSGLSDVHYGLFSGCSNLRSIDIPNNVTSIRWHAFQNCTNLKTVNIGAGVTSIGQYAFFHCTNLDSIDIPQNVTKIENNAFRNCTNLKEVTFHEGISEIGYYAFRGCDSITSIEIPYTLSAIGTYAFGECANLHKVTLNSNAIASIDHQYDSQVGRLSLAAYFGPVKEYVIGDSVTRIGEYAFFHQASPADGWSSEWATYNNYVDTITIGKNVKWIGACAFKGCTSLKAVTCFASTPPTLETRGFVQPDESIWVFSGVDCSKIPLYVPAESVEDYRHVPTLGGLVALGEWWKFQVRPLGATNAETNDVQVTSSETTAEIIWPVVIGAATYELVIKDSSGNIICTFIFNSQGQLTSFTFSAPVHRNAPQQTQYTGFSYTITGLEKGTTYDYILTAKNSEEIVIDVKYGIFTTLGESTGFEDIADKDLRNKILRNGQIFIQQGNKVYTIQGQVVK